MSQYTVYLNPSRGSRDTVPYVVEVQSGLLDELPTRLIIPLSRVGVGQVRLPTALTPHVEVEGEWLALLPHLAAPIAVRHLRSRIASLEHRSGDIRSAMDAVFSGI